MYKLQFCTFIIHYTCQPATFFSYTVTVHSFSASQSICDLVLAFNVGDIHVIVYGG